MDRGAGSGGRPAPRPRSRINAKSEHAKAADKILEASRAVVRARSGGRCEVKLAGICTGQAQDGPHHLVPRGRARRWPGLHLPDNLVDICPPCHAEVHQDRDGEMTAAGWLRSPPPVRGLDTGGEIP